MQIQFLKSFKVYYFLIIIPLLFSGCQTTDLPSYEYPYSVGYNIVSYTYGQYTKKDTTYLDTSVTKNRIHNLAYSLNDFTTLTFGGIATILGYNTGDPADISGLITETYSLTLTGTPVTSIVGLTSTFTITSYFITGYKTDTTVNLYPFITTISGSLLHRVDSSYLNASNLITFPGNGGVSSATSAIGVIYRNGSETTILEGTLSGNEMSEVPATFLSILTLGNKDLKNTSVSDKIKGWHITKLTNISYDGGTDDITDAVTIGINKSASGLLTYFPDGFYTFISAVDSTYNQFGWYRISLESGMPIGIVYHTLKSGPEFKDPPLYPGPYQGYGIWGVSYSTFYPLIRLDQYRQAVLTTEPYEY